ncbi:hypothetical protein SLE2022_272440 [Rubroshorea leprosula]
MGRTGLVIAALLLALSHENCSAKVSQQCPASSCGNVLNIHLPFQLSTDPLKCRDPKEMSDNNIIYLDVYHQLSYGFELWCFPYPSIWSKLYPVLLYKWQRRHLSMYDSTEEFLQSNNNLMPIWYSYSDIKKMTNGFKEKLGKGGFGKVYEARLKSDGLAAVKLLGKSKVTSQDFFSEVATIGRIQHVNVVKLIGFCSEGSNHALARGTLGHMAPELVYRNIGGVSHKVKPSDSLSMNKAMEMLEADLESLEMPPRPFQIYPYATEEDGAKMKTNSTELSSYSSDDDMETESESASLIENEN